MKPTRNQYDFANAIIQRTRERMNPSMSVKLRQIDDLYYWIMSNMIRKVENSSPPRPYYEVNILASRAMLGNTLYVREWESGIDLRGAFAVDANLTEKQFREIMKEVASIFNSLPNFTATYLETNVANLKVKLVLTKTFEPIL